MQKFLEDLSSPYFWLTAGFFALLVNIVSSYIKSPMDRAFGKVNKTWLIRTKQREKRLYDLCDAMADPEYLAYVRWASHMTAWGMIFQTLCAFFAGALALATKYASFQAAPESRTTLLYCGYVFIALAVWSLYRLYTRMTTLMLQERALRLYEELRRPPKEWLGAVRKNDKQRE